MQDEEKILKASSEKKWVSPTGSHPADGRLLNRNLAGLDWVLWDFHSSEQKEKPCQTAILTQQAIFLKCKVGLRI